MNKRKIEVVQQALVLFREKGIIQTSIQDIIERSGISKGTFYNYFTSKNECIFAVIEHVRYEASLIRSELQLGKSKHDLDVLIDQMVKISIMNQRYGLPSLFEQMLVSMDKELKEYVMLYRIHEVSWFSNRIIDIYGEEVRSHSFEVAILFYGMMHHIKFIHRIIEPSFIEEEVSTHISALLCYIEPILHTIQTKKNNILKQDYLEKLLSPIDHENIKAEDINADFNSFIQKENLTKFQLEITESIAEELKRESVRTAVMSALLPSFLNLFKNDNLYDEARRLHTKVVLYLSQT